MNIRSVKADFLLLTTAVIWGAAFVAQRVGMDYVGPLTFNGTRFAIGALALVPLIKFLDGKKKKQGSYTPADRKQLLIGGIISGAALFAGATLQQWGVVYTTAGNAGFITGLYVVLVPIMGLLWKQKTGTGTWTGAVLAVVGMYLLSVHGSLKINFGDMLVFFSAFFWAGHVLIIAWLSPRMDSIKLACVQFAACSIFSLILAVALEKITLEGLIGGAIPILYGGLMSVGVAYTLQVVAQKDAKPAHAAIILSLESFFAAVSGCLLLGETMTTQGIIGCGLMLCGMMISQLKQ
jgi:drug/metabolite transporter (DMT)-like permease